MSTQAAVGSGNLGSSSSSPDSTSAAGSGTSNLSSLLGEASALTGSGEQRRPRPDLVELQRARFARCRA